MLNLYSAYKLPAAFENSWHFGLSTLWYFLLKDIRLYIECTFTELKFWILLSLKVYGQILLKCLLAPIWTTFITYIESLGTASFSLGFSTPWRPPWTCEKAGQRTLLAHSRQSLPPLDISQVHLLRLTPQFVHSLRLTPHFVHLGKTLHLFLTLFRVSESIGNRKSGVYLIMQTAELFRDILKLKFLQSLWKLISEV